MPGTSGSLLNPSYSGGRDQSQPGHIVFKILSQKKKKQNRAGGMVQVVELLLSKLKTLSTNSSTTKNIK
jgi:hypothetical protein